MEILMTPEYYVIVDGEETLWCSRIDGKLQSRKRSGSQPLTDAVCLGTVHGIIGKFQPHPDSDQRLVLIRQTSLIGYLPGNHQVYKVNKIVLVPLSMHEAPELEMEPCTKHLSSCRRPERSPASELQQRALQKTWKTIKTATAQVKPRRTVQNRERDKYERRLLDELLKMFNDTDSFYFSPTGDLTNTMQRQVEQPPLPAGSPRWERLDERFFWNREMLRDLTEIEGGEHWVLPIIQGFVQVERCQLDSIDSSQPEAALGQDSSGAWIDVQSVAWPPAKEFTMSLVSRRSRYRAGTRYKRRGVDEMGKCANYVETEQIFEHAAHVVSFVQVRGSVPVFWSQPGYKYRPPPRLDRDEEETKQAFAKHFAEQVALYGSQVVVSLVEQTGKEKLLADAYLNHVLHLDCPELTYVSFDFHEYCRGMRFENVSVLIDGIKELIRDMRYCWLDQQGLICGQRGVFRVNCIDCLDRTNIVQTAIAKTAMDTQFVRLGLLPPEGLLPTACRRIFQMLWANNGDIISRQYAGTVALKGDFTRTGSRCLAGMMKDGYNSANRYYVNRFKDAYRQATIDLMLGNPITEDFMAVSPEQDDEPVLEMQDQEHQEHVKQLIEHCKKMLIPESEVVLGGWALIDADPVTGDPGQADMDSILVLTKDSYYVAEYDDQTDRITKYQRVFLEDLEKMELGPEPSLFKSRHYCIRFHYLVNGQSGYFHMFRSTGTRFFNNVAVPISGEEETIESLKAICESFKVALSVKSLSVPLFEGKLERRRSKLPFVQGERPGSLGLAPLGAMTRNMSEGQLMAFVSVGCSRALSNVTSQFARLNPMRGLTKRPTTPLGALTEGSFQVDSSSDSEEDSARWLRQPLPAAERTLSSDYSSDSDAPEPGHDTLLESCGILATSPRLASCERRPPAHRSLDIDDFVLDAMHRASLRQHKAPAAALAPRIQVSSESPAEAPSGGRLRQLSKSSEELESRPASMSPGNFSRLFVLEEGPREPAKMKMSHSESAIQDFSLPGPNPMSSPIVIKKDLVLSPLSRIAKGVQTLGFNLRPTAIVGRRAPLPMESEALRQRKRVCRSHILEL